MLLIYIIASSLESIIGKKIKDLLKIKFKKNDDFKKLVESWKAVLEATVPLHSVLLPALEGGLNNPKKVEEVSTSFNDLITAIQTTLKIQLKDFTSLVKTL